MQSYTSLFTSIEFCDIKLSELDAHREHKGWLPTNRFYPKLAVAIAECRRDGNGNYYHYASTSTPHRAGIPGIHAEESLIKHLGRIGELANVVTIFITRSPCPLCTQYLLDAFKIRKPIIKFLCVNGKPGSRKQEQAVMSLKDMLRNGFRVDAWDITTEKRPVDYLLLAVPDRKKEVCKSLTRCRMLFQKRAKSTRLMIRYIQMKKNELSF